MVLGNGYRWLSMAVANAYHRVCGSNPVLKEIIWHQTNFPVRYFKHCDPIQLHKG